MEVNWSQLLRGGATLTVDIFIGFVVGAAIISTGLADRLMRRVLPRLRRWGIGATLGSALAVSVGSAKAGAAIIASALDSRRISPRTALWGTLALAFPAYLRRWTTTLVMACSLAGTAGGIFACALLLRSALKFAVSLYALKRGEQDDLPFEGTKQGLPRESVVKFARRLLKTLPLAWLFYALAFLLVPAAENWLQSWLKGSAFFPLPALAVAAASFAHVSAALALAGGSLAAGELTTAQAVFALIFGNSLSVVTRLVRTNSGHYFGLFPGSAARSMLTWNVVISAASALLTLALAALPLCF
ncbi:MAG: hypothetical protein ACOYD9_04905 [Pyramidobacter sp.]